MPRALSIHRATVPMTERARYFERLRARRNHYQSAHCRFWVFEETALGGAFVEFVEADDATTLAAAHATAPDSVLDPVRIFQQVEID